MMLSWDCLPALPVTQVPPLCPTMTGYGVHHCLGVSPWHLSLWHARQLHQHLISPSHSLMVLNLSNSSLNSATILSRSSTCSHLTQVEFLTPSPDSCSLSTPCSQSPEQTHSWAGPPPGLPQSLWGKFIS